MADQTLPVVVPDNLKLVSDDDLAALQEALKARGQALKLEPTVTPELVQEAMAVQTGFERVTAEIQGRAVTRAQAAEAEARRLEQARADALEHVTATDGDGDTSGGTDGTVVQVDGDGVVTKVQPPMDPLELAAAAARGTVAALASMGVRFPNGMRPDEAQRQATTALAAAATTRPRDQLPERRLAVTAGVDIPGVATGGDMVGIDDLVSAFQRRAKAMPVTRDGDNARGAIVASVHNEYEHVVDDRNTAQEVADLLDNIIRTKDNMEALLAGGGWCAPSTLRYDFFNIADPVDGMVDLPTVGITRGGLRYPVSPSLADVIGPAFGGFSTTFNVASVPFLYSETDDIATVTGNPNKPTVRVPCAGFAENRLECYGYQVTAGNLTDDAWPEQTRNFLRLVLAAHEHAMNGRLLALMVANSSAAITGGGFAVSGNPVFNQVIGGLALAAVDYRARYGMADNTILEAVGPKWLLGAIVADLAWRSGSGTELLAATTAQINQFFASRGVRIQWVDDWQVRAAGLPGVSGGLTNWPTTATFMIFAAGTFVRGDGMTLDLGVIRDSVLNAENDFTAAFTEECHLIAKIGHESRLYTIRFSVNGAAPASIPTGSYL